MTKQSKLISAAAALMVLVAIVVLAWRGAFGGQPPIARLTQVTGTPVERDFADNVFAWEPATIGTTFALGDGARTGRDATAMLALVDGSKLAVDSGAMIRFLADTEEGDLGIDVNAGAAILHTGARPLTLRTHVGLATIEGNSRVVLTRTDTGMGFDIKMGALRFRDASGSSHQLDAGERVSVGIGMALLTRDERGQARDAAPAADITLETESEALQARRPDREAFETLSAGRHQLGAGTTVRLPEGAQARVSGRAGRAVLESAGDYLLGEGDALVETQSGALSATAQERDVRVRVPGGTIIVRATAESSRAQVSIGPEQGRVRVMQGEVMAILMGQTTVLHEADDHTWTHQDAGEDMDPQAAESGPEYWNVKTRGGGSFVVHAPEVPVAIAFDFSHHCPGEGQVELRRSRQRSRGTGSANLLLAAGARAYLIRCITPKGKPGRIVARGVVHVQHDPGTRDLPPRPPKSVVDADGRTYTIYYPNQLPDIEVRWPNAPQEPEYRLDVDGEILSLDQPSRLFKSGSLRDGSHRLTFSAGKRSSRATTVVVRFDNTAPTASLIQPADRSFSVGDTVKVEGVAQSSWSVSIEGGEVTQYPNDKFSGEVTTSAERPDIVVRLTNRRKGTHYYLRRAAESP